MRRALPLALAAALVLALEPVGGAAAALPPRLGVDVTACATGAEPATRAAAFTASMPARTGTARMAVRFELFVRGARGGAQRLRARGLGAWERSEPGRAGFVFTKRVELLAAPATYRVRVQFRWYDAEGRLQRRAARRSAPCRQPDPRPQLRVLALVPAAGGGARVTVANVGTTGAGPFAAVLAVGDVPGPATRLEAGLAPGAVAELALAGPPCAPGQRLRAVVDGAGEVDEADERDNARTLQCPA